MEVLVPNNKLKRALENPGACRKAFGIDMAKKLALRVAALAAAESLVDFWPPNSGPERCHELKGEFSGTFSMDLKQPYRLLFKPTEADSLPLFDERERWRNIKTVEITSVEDTHG